MEKSVPIICPYCGVGCNLEIRLNQNGEPVKSSASGRNMELNGKYLCIKGLSVHELINSKSRLSAPLVRKNKILARTTWDEAMAFAAGRLKQVMDQHGPQSIGMLCSGKILNEDAYLCQKFQRAVIGNNNIDNCARLCHGPSEVGLRKQLGYGAVSTFHEDYNTAETIVMVGAHTDVTHPVIWMWLRKRARKGEIALVLADPRNTDLVRHAAVHLNPRPGTDIFWINALAKIMYTKNWHDEAFCRTQTIAFEAYLKSLENFDVQNACSRSGVDYNDLEKAAALIHGKKTIFIWGMGLTQHAHGTDNISALVNLVLLTGNVGKPGCGVSPLRGQNNVQGAGDMGALPNLLPGHMAVADEAARIHTGALWNAKLPSTRGLSAPEMIHEIASGKIRALYVVGENPALSEPQSSFVSWMLQRLDLLIVQDIFMTETAKLAHVIFPAAMIGEKEGTFTNAARRIQFTSGGIAPLKGVKPDWRIIADMAGAFGFEWNYSSAKDVWEEVRQQAPVFSGVTHDRLKGSPGLFWPCYDEKHPGTPRLYEDGFAFRDRRARFFPVSAPENLMEATDTYPYVLITGRLLGHFNTGEMSRRSKKLMKGNPEPFLTIHADDAKKEGIDDGELIRLTSPYGTLTVKAAVGRDVTPGYLFGPIHFESANFNTLMSAVPHDPQARMPALKIMPVKISKSL
ncbi:MAG: formate dehydrogenase subunit alpha [Deltaproteobacteria bacterium]|nr:formate dehydrogenase subunit alpha [Deltaproteobacteria bacterium]